MSPLPALKLFDLRDIGWKLWDPIGMLAVGETWIGHPAADEYDGYLVAVADGLRRGWAREHAVEELLAATEFMGLSRSATGIARAEATVDAIRAHLRA